MKTNITVTVIIACVAMIVLSGIVTGMNTMSNVSPTFDLTAYDTRTPGFTLGTTPTIPTPYSIEGTAMYEAAEVVEPKKISDKSISIWETGTKNIATQYFESMYNPSVVSPFSFEGMTGIAPERKEPTEPTEPVELEFISPTGYVEDINPITGLRRTTGTAIRTTPEGTGLFASLGSADFSGITEPEPDTKKNFEEARVVLETAHEDIYEMSEVGGSFGNTLHTNDTELINEIFKQLDESALSTKAKKLEAVFNKFDKLWERARPSPGLARTLELSTEAGLVPTTGGAWAEQQRKLSAQAELEEPIVETDGAPWYNPFAWDWGEAALNYMDWATRSNDRFYDRDPVVESSKKPGVMNVTGSLSTVITEAVAGKVSSTYTGGFNAAGGYKAKKLEKLEDYLKAGLSVSLPNMQDVKLNPKL